MNDLLNLPGEVRNVIYELSLTEGHEEQETIELEQTSPESPFRRMQTYHPGAEALSQTLGTSGLPLTCRTIRHETLRFYYSLNHFYFQTEYLKSKEKLLIVQRIQEWVTQIGARQAREIRDVTISLSSLKGQSAPTSIEWEHMSILRRLFHPKARVKIRFCLEGNGTATFTLGRRDEILGELERKERAWCAIWQVVRKLTAFEASLLAGMYRREVERLFKGMPEEV